MPQPKITPFKVDVAQTTLDRILSRVKDATWPSAPAHSAKGASAPWGYGTNLDYMKELAAYWADGFDWRKAEAALNAHPQFKAPVTVGTETLELHFYHVKSARLDATPIILSHGWPGSVFEFLQLIEPLSNPPADQPAFHVVVPSLPGYGFSQCPANPISPRHMGAYFSSLMVDVLGYGSFMAQGGDWGGPISAAMALDCDACTALHINIHGWWTPGVGPEMEEEQAHAAAGQAMQLMEGSYFTMQMAKPVSLGLALEDSPIGWASWVIEKFNTWSHTDGNDIESAYSKDQMLTNIMLYLVTNTVGTSLWPYRGVFEDGFGEPIAPGTQVTIPTAIANLPHEIPMYAFPPRTQVERSYCNIVQWTDFDAGGHFAALEQPEAFVEDLREFAAKL